MHLRRPARIPLTVLAVACVVISGLILRSSRPKSLKAPNQPRLTTATPASGVAVFIPEPSLPPDAAQIPAEGKRDAPFLAPPVSDELNDASVVRLRELAESDPRALAESALNQPPGSRLRARMLLEALLLWAERDPATAAEWLAAQRPAPEFDLGLSALAQNPALYSKTPDTALSLAGEIIDPSLRMSAQRTVMQAWARRDPAQLRAALAKPDTLSPGEMELLVAELNDLLAAR